MSKVGHFHRFGCGCVMEIIRDDYDTLLGDYMYGTTVESCGQPGCLEVSSSACELADAPTIHPFDYALAETFTG